MAIVYMYLLTPYNRKHAIYNIHCKIYSNNSYQHMQVIFIMFITTIATDALTKST